MGTDLNGLVHTVVTTQARASDFSLLPKLLRGAEALWRSGLLERAASHRRQGAWGALSGQSQTPPGSAAE